MKRVPGLISWRTSFIEEHSRISAPKKEEKNTNTNWNLDKTAAKFLKLYFLKKATVFKSTSVVKID